MKRPSPPTNSLTRRSFLKTSAIAAAGSPFILNSSVLGNEERAAANSRIGMGFIGCGLISKTHIASFPGIRDIQPIAVCDLRTNFRKKALDKLSQKGFDDVVETPLYEEVLANPKIDVVAVMTPDHWHAHLAIAAMKAGKDVYVEKPMTLTIEEGKAVVEAQNKYGRILQVGSQQRSTAYFRIAANLIRNGMIGELKEIHCSLGSFPQPPENEEIAPVPEGFDYDRWLGPTPYYDYSEHRVRGNYKGGWRCYWDYGSRKFGDWGAHHFDIVQWALGRDETGPVEFIPAGYEGAKYHHFRYADGLTVWRDNNKMLVMPDDDAEADDSKKKKSKPPQIRFIGTEGDVYASRGFVKTSPKELVRHKFTDADETVYESKNHRQNFIDCVKSRKAPICPAEVGHRSGTICQLAGIAERLGRQVKWDPAAEQIVGDNEAEAMQDRPRRPGYELPSIS